MANKTKRGGKKGLKIAIIAILVVLLLVGGFFGFKAYKNARFEKEADIFQQGIAYGYTNAIIQIMNVSYTCQPFPVYIGNQSRNLIAVDCLNLA